LSLDPTLADGSPPRVRHRRQRPRSRRLVGVALAIFLVLWLSVVAWYEVQVHAVGAAKGTMVTIDIASGEPVSSVISELASKGVVTSSLAFSISSLIHGQPTITPGWYSLPTGSTFGAVRSVLAAPSNTDVLDVPPGFTIREITARLATQMPAPFVAGVRSALHDGTVRSGYQPPGSTSLEGLVAPGRYLIAPATTPSSLVHAMVQRFVAMASAKGLAPGTTVRGRDAYSIITEASVVEKEGYQVRNMAKVARVIDNRLAADMPLQMDSTVLYALKQDGGPVTHATLQTPSAYNTYLHRGLPPTPICVVSPQALAAAISPPAGPWLYFTVVDKTGTEAFATTFAEQLANERLAQERGL